MKTIIALTLLCLAASNSGAHPVHEEAFSVAAVKRSQVTSTAESQNRITISVEGGFRVIRANGVPNHKTGAFPNRNNPNVISAQNYEFRVPTNPQIASQPTALRMQPFGVAVNGIVFDPSAAEWWNNERHSMWQYEPMSGSVNLGVDESNAHVQPTGAYHYHAIPTGLLNKLTGGQPKMVLVGWAADGFPIYGPWCHADARNSNSSIKKMKSSYRIKQGKRPSGPGGNYDGSFVADYEYVHGLGDLDECNGRTGVTAEFPQGTYYYVLTEDFPFIPRYFKGTPDSSFMRKGPPPGRRGPGGPGGPPPGTNRENRAELPTFHFPLANNNTTTKPQAGASWPERAGSAKGS